LTVLSYVQMLVSNPGMTVWMFDWFALLLGVLGGTGAESESGDGQVEGESI